MCRSVCLYRKVLDDVKHDTQLSVYMYTLLYIFRLTPVSAEILVCY